MIKLIWAWQLIFQFYNKYEGVLSYKVTDKSEKQSTNSDGDETPVRVTSIRPRRLSEPVLPFVILSPGKLPVIFESHWNLKVHVTQPDEKKNLTIEFHRGVITSDQIDEDTVDWVQNLHHEVKRFVERLQ